MHIRVATSRTSSYCGLWNNSSNVSYHCFEDPQDSLKRTVLSEGSGAMDPHENPVTLMAYIRVIGAGAEIAAAILMMKMNTVEAAPVSYTHLDVYKRQASA